MHPIGSPVEFDLPLIPSASVLDQLRNALPNRLRTWESHTSPGLRSYNRTKYENVSTSEVLIR